MKLARPSHGDMAWLGLVAYVAAYDVYAILSKRDTLSGSYARALSSPRRRWPTLLFAAYVNGHLNQVIPARLDPLRRWTSTSIW